jgi:hypothetical protein
MAISSGISFKRISDSVSKTKSVAAETGKTTIRISKLLNKNISDKRNISSDIKSLKSRRIQREKRNILIDRMSAPLIAIKPTGPRILSASDSGTSVVNRLLGFVGYLTAGWALSNLPTWIGLGEQFVTRITIATSILGNYGDELLKVITDVGDVFSSVVQNLSRFDFSDSSYLVRSSLNELKLSIDSLGDGISQAFQVLIQPFSAIEKIPDAYDKLPSILPGFDGPEPPPSGGSGGKWKPLLDLIASGESSSSGGYDAMYPGRNTKKEGKPVSKMTISQASRYAGDPGDGRNYAVGRYQFTTVKAQAKAAGLNPDKDTFSPENQDRMAINIIEGKRKGKYWLSGKITDEEFSEYLAGKWGAFRSASGYVLPGNTGSIGFDKLKPILKK